MPTFRTLKLAALGFATGASLGCFAVLQREEDVDRTPITNTGAGASIIYPGQAPPMHPGNYHPGEAGYGAAPAQPPSPYAAPTAPGGAQGQPPTGPPMPGTAAPGSPPGYAAAPTQPAYGAGHGAEPVPRSPGSSSGGGVSMLGGTQVDETQHLKVNEAPIWMKYVTLPFALVAAPFKYAADELRGEPEPGPEVPRLEQQGRPQARRAPAPMDYETAALQNMERELDQRSPAATTAPPTRPATSLPQGSATAISDELSNLRRLAAAPAQPKAVGAAPRASSPRGEAPRTSASAPPKPAPRASGEVDRDHDGQTDHWIHRAGHQIAREDFDDDFDGRPDRTLHYDTSSGDVARIEEDADRDGRFDSWTAVRGGKIVGRRVDGNRDGHVDTWSFYREGVITRLERDADGDGFRDHVAYYADGRLQREESDGDADGSTDLVKYYDDGERVERVEEDSDRDGSMDVVSHYEDGRLTRREVLDASILGLGSAPETEHN